MYAVNRQTLTVSDFGGAIKIESDLPNAPIELYLKDKIVSVSGVFTLGLQKNPIRSGISGLSDTNSSTELLISFSFGESLRIELQHTKEATWNNGTLTALNKAITDVQSWI